MTLRWVVSGEEFPLWWQGGRYKKASEIETPIRLGEPLFLHVKVTEKRSHKEGALVVLRSPTLVRVQRKGWQWVKGSEKVSWKKKEKISPRKGSRRRNGDLRGGAPPKKAVDEGR